MALMEEKAALISKTSAATIDGVITKKQTAQEILKAAGVDANTMSLQENSKETLAHALVTQLDSGATLTEAVNTLFENGVIDKNTKKKLLNVAATKALTAARLIGVGAIAAAAITLGIYIAKRKEEIQKNKHKKEKKKEPKRKIKTKEQKAQNRFALLGFLVAVIVAGAGLYIWKKPTVLDFQALPIEVELGDKLPTSVSTYVKPGIGETLNEMAYTIDTSEVKFDQIGEYTYTVKYLKVTVVPDDYFVNGAFDVILSHLKEK